MPTQQLPPQLPDVDLEQIQKWLLGGKDFTDPEALSLVNRTFELYEGSPRRKEQERRWAEDDKLYFGHAEEKKWENGKARSAIGIPLAFDQLESIYASLSSEIFEQRPYWFGVEATERSTPQEAFLVRAALAAHMDDFDPKDFTSIKVKMKQCLKEFLQRGNCAGELGWDPVRQRLVFNRVPLKNFFPDPNLQEPWLDRSSGVIVRDLMTVESLDDLRSQSEFDIPPLNVLNGLAKAGGITASDAPTLNSPNTHTANPRGDKNLPNPANQKIEVLRYWSKDRLIWVLGRRWPCLNVKNPFGFIPCLWAPLFTVLDEPWGMSVPDAIDGEQKLIQGLTNARIDELSLNLHPPRIWDRSDLQGLNASERQWGPGSTASSGVDPSKVAVLFPTGATQQAFQEVALAEARAARRLGVNEGVQSGVPTPSNANRTATGVQAQAGAVSQRLRTPVENFEDYFLGPLLYKAQSIISRFGSQDRTIGVGPEGEPIQVPRAVTGQFVRFKLTAASSLARRAQLGQTLATVTAMIQSGPFQGMLSSTGKTIDTNEYVRLVNDASGAGTQYAWVRPMTPEEQQQSQQPSPDVAAQLQIKQLELQTRESIASQSNQTKLGVAQIDAEGKKEVAEETGAARIISSLKPQQTGEKKDDKTGTSGS